MKKIIKTSLIGQCTLITFVMKEQANIGGRTNERI